MKPKILYIDDEKNNLIGFKAAFRLHVQVLTAVTPIEAISLLMEHEDIKIIFCDQRMPDISGVDLLEQIKALFPLPVRIMITGFADIDEVIGAINKGNIFQYIKKPWKEDDIHAVIKDALDFYENTSMLSLKNEDLKTAYKELDKFAYSVSHDIRGPLSGILTGIDFAQQSDNIGELKELLKMMKKSLLQLDDYIIAMHQYYNNQKGKLSVIEIDFDQIVLENKNIFSVFANANQISFETSVEQKEKFKSDLVSIKLILNNLLSNAFKYQQNENEHKKVSLSIEVQNGITLIKVSDNGIGISENETENIFNLHYRSNNNNSSFGLGLYNVNGAVMKLGGQIDVHSTIKEGTTFKISLPSLQKEN